MRIYHGSVIEIPAPLLGKGKPNNDYGRGFYCTEDIEMAREWACKGKEPPGFSNIYELSADGLNILDLSSPDYTILNWMAVLLANRTFDLDTDIAIEVRDYLMANFMPPIQDADIVIGYRADDSYFNYADSFVNNALSLRRLNDALHLGRLGMQVALRTDRAFECLRYLGAEEVSWDEYHPRYVARDADARTQWREVVKKSPRAADDMFAVDIIRRGCAMAIRSYNEVYLNEAKRHLGVATDYLANVCRVPVDRIGYIYASSATMVLFGRGDPGIVAGLSGTELGQRLYHEIRPDEEPPVAVNAVAGRSPEYWGGWALAHFQWHWCKTFRWIFARVSMSDILAKYRVYHEMDVSRFLEDFMRELESVNVEKNLRRMRLAAGYSQSELSRLSGVNIRNIQLYEQGVQDINRASASTLAALARPLACAIEDLME